LYPTDYDRKTIQIYTQSKLISNDFIKMVNDTTPFYTEGETWKWGIDAPFQYTKIVDIPDSTLSKSKVGIDGQEFELVVDSAEFQENSTVVIGNRLHGPQLAVVSDPIPSGAAYRQKFTLLSSNPQTDYVDKKWLQTGMDIKSGTSIIGEFTQKLPGLGKMADKLEMFESLSSATGRSHTITKRADQTSVDGKMIDFASDSQGNPKDIVA